MKERPILFSGPMVRALLDGRKTQTRRVVKSFRHTIAGVEHDCIKDVDGGPSRLDLAPRGWELCAYGAPGDRLWVKETWRPRAALNPWDLDIRYAADGADRTIKDGEFGDQDWIMPKAAARGNVSPLFMPRWASRLTLQITDVRVERLQHISEADARAEGLPWGYDHHPIAEVHGEAEGRAYCRKCAGWGVHGSLGANLGVTEVDCAECDTPPKMYRNLWEHINGPGSWETNPWVWAVSFEVLR